MLWNNGATDAESYKKDILSVAIICNNNMLGNKSAHKQDDAEFSQYHLRHVKNISKTSI